ncbi:HD domain-containing protein [Paenibacillus sp. FSL K6-2862]|uniref:HD domain-containing protein n=1 Tax=Paenibacillus sp. FSL K6-2862 TaxID=2921484 RepID=UPI0030F5CD76
MINLPSILSDSMYQPIQELYEQGYTFMNEKIVFWLPDSEWHTKSHCARVMLLALFIGYQKGLSEEELSVLQMVSVFHDSRRLDDGIDKGHGRRAAEYYKEFCLKHNLSFDKRVYNVSYYHDQDDSLGLSEINMSFGSNEGVDLLYQIFKDADALDRFRLGEDALEVSFLRTKEAVRLVGFAKNLLLKSNELMHG